MRTLYLTSLLLLSSLLQLDAKIIKINSIATLTHHACDEETLVLVDLDETLIRPEGHFGSDAWWQQQLDTEIQNGSTYMQAIEKHLPNLVAAHKTLVIKPMEDATAHIINLLQQLRLQFQLLPQQ